MMIMTKTIATHTASPLPLAELDLQRGHFRLAAWLPARRGGSVAMLRLTSPLARSRCTLVTLFLFLFFLWLLYYLFVL